METLLQIGLSNTVLAAGLAVVATLVGAIWRRPAVAHGLWLLVLLKLVTPPLISVPLPRSAPTAVAAIESPPAAVWIVEADAVAKDVPAPAEPPAEAVAVVPAAVTPSWYGSAALLWLAGSAGWLALAAWRAGRFQALLRHAEAAPEWLRAEAEFVAARLGLPYCPPVWLLPGRVSPMLWSLGGSPRLFLPAELLGRLGAEARAALLAHELAHLRRGDHWVRWLELICTILYWWNPMLWWARHRLRAAEEQCCDAWVVWALPRARRAYATALVDTVDFLSEAPPATPLLASGVGPVHDLRKRVTMIMRGTTPRDLSWVGGLAVLGLGAVLLPLSGSWADEPDEQDEVVRKREIRVEVERKPADPKVRGELEEARARLDEARARLREAEAQMRRAEERAAGRGGEAGGQIRGKMKIIIVGPDGKTQEIDVPEGARIVAPEGLEKRRIELNLRRDSEPRREGRPPAPGGPDAGRANDLERRLDQLMREVENLRRELRQPQGGPRGGGGSGGGPSAAPVPPRPPTPPAPPPARPVEPRSRNSAR